MASLVCFGSPPYRVVRVTKSHLPAKPREGVRSDDEAEDRGGGSTTSGGGGDCAKGKEENVEHGALGGDGGVGGVDGVIVGGVDVGGRIDAAADAGDRFITAFISLSFVAPPGRAAPEAQSVKYRMDLSLRQGSQEVAVFLGEADYSDAGGT